MVTIIKDLDVPGIEVIPCRLEGPRGIVKTFLLHDDRDTVLIDTGYDERDAHLIAARLDAIGRDVGDLSACIITHRHSDHVGGLQALREMADFPLLAHAEEGEAIAKQTGITLDGHLTDGQDLGLLGGAQIVHLPGHTPGSITVFWPRHRALFAGDAIFSAGEHLMVPPAFICMDPDQARESIRKLLDLGLDIDRVLVAHGDDVHHDAHAPFERILAERRTF